MDDKNGFAYFLLGIGLGVAAGVLLAPKSGAETRDYLKNKAGEGSDYLRTRAEDGREYLRRRTDDIKGSAADIYEKGRTRVARHRENLSAAVEAGKQAYRDAVENFESSPSGEGV